MHRFTVLYLVHIRLLTGCGRAEYPAEYKIPESEFTLRIDLKQVNPPHAEYERKLLIVRSGLPLLRVDLGVDIGGYTVINVYKLPSGEFLLAHDGNPQYKVDPATGSVQAEVLGIPPRGERRPREAVFNGAFDFDDDHVWRFLSAWQRTERDPVILNARQANLENVTVIEA